MNGFLLLASSTGNFIIASSVNGLRSTVELMKSYLVLLVLGKTEETTNFTKNKL